MTAGVDALLNMYAQDNLLSATTLLDPLASMPSSVVQTAQRDFVRVLQAFAVVYNVALNLLSAATRASFRKKENVHMCRYVNRSWTFPQPLSVISAVNPPMAMDKW